MTIFVVWIENRNVYIPSGMMAGVKSSVVSGVSLVRSHTSMPSAAPAAMAAPREVVSVMLGRAVGWEDSMSL